MIFEHGDYRTFLKEVLVERIQKNPNYSLRGMASHLGISAPMLSGLLKGKKNLSAGKAIEISGRLNLSSKEEAYFVGLVQLFTCKSSSQKEKIITKLKDISPAHEVRDLSIDQYHSIANWICAAGVALLDNHPKGLTAEEVADRLSVTKFEAEEAMDRWVRLDIVDKKLRTHKYVKLSHEHMLMSSKTPDGSIRKFHKTMLEKAIAALETQSNDEKFVGSETISFDPKDLSEVSEIIEEAVSKILLRAKKGKTKTSVYHLGFQFFRITKKEKK
jgi:uncharacterized protein (TIGR02147 family)